MVKHVEERSDAVVTLLGLRDRNRVMDGQRRRGAIETQEPGRDLITRGLSVSGVSGDLLDDIDVGGSKAERARRPEAKDFIVGRPLPPDARAPQPLEHSNGLEERKRVALRQ